MGILELVTIILVILKGLGYIDWSWWICFAPLMISVAIYAVIISVYRHEQKKNNGKEKKSKLMIYL